MVQTPDPAQTPKHAQYPISCCCVFFCGGVLVCVCVRRVGPAHRQAGALMSVRVCGCVCCGDFSPKDTQKITALKWPLSGLLGNRNRQFVVVTQALTQPSPTQIRFHAERTNNSHTVQAHIWQKNRTHTHKRNVFRTNRWACMRVCNVLCFVLVFATTNSPRGGGRGALMTTTTTATTMATAAVKGTRAHVWLARNSTRPVNILGTCVCCVDVYVYVAM